LWNEKRTMVTFHLVVLDLQWNIKNFAVTYLKLLKSRQEALMLDRMCDLMAVSHRKI